MQTVCRPATQVLQVFQSWQVWQVLQVSRAPSAVLALECKDSSVVSKVFEMRRRFFPKIFENLRQNLGPSEKTKIADGGENRGKPHWILWWTTWWPMDHGRRFSSSPIFGENFGRPAENNIIYFVCMQRYREARRPPRAARYGTKSYCTNHAPQCAEKKKMGRSTRTRGPYAAHTCRARRAQRGEREGGGQQNDAVNSRC